MILGPAIIRKALFGQPLQGMEFNRRGYHLGPSAVRGRLELVAKGLVHGYNAAIENPDLESLYLRFSMIDRSWRGLAFEGMTMGLAALDAVRRWGHPRRALELCAVEPGFRTIGYVGIGMGLGVFRWNPRRAVARLDKVLGWFVANGFGFFYGLLRPGMVTVRRRRARGLTGAMAREFDAGVGRSLWFFECADVDRVVARVRSFEESRRADLWSGVGTACTYAGGVGPAELDRLVSASGEHVGSLARGAALAAHIRTHARNVEPHVELALRTIWGSTATEVALVFDDCADEARETPGPERAYQRFTELVEACHGSAAQATPRTNRGLS